MFDKEAYLLEKIKSSGKKKIAIKSRCSIFFPQNYLNETHVKFIDGKFLYRTVD